MAVFIKKNEKYKNKIYECAKNRIKQTNVFSLNTKTKNMT